MIRVSRNELIQGPKGAGLGRFETGRKAAVNDGGWYPWYLEGSRKVGEEDCTPVPPPMLTCSYLFPASKSENQVSGLW